MSLLIKETQLQRIIRKTGRKPIQCKCKLCKQQCHTPCLGTPQDVLRLIEAGYRQACSNGMVCRNPYGGS